VILREIRQGILLPLAAETIGQAWRSLKEEIRWAINGNRLERRPNERRSTMKRVLFWVPLLTVLLTFSLSTNADAAFSFHVHDGHFGAWLTVPFWPIYAPVVRVCAAPLSYPFRAVNRWVYHWTRPWKVPFRGRPGPRVVWPRAVHRRGARPRRSPVHGHYRPVRLRPHSPRRPGPPSRRW